MEKAVQFAKEIYQRSEYKTSFVDHLDSVIAGIYSTPVNSGLDTSCAYSSQITGQALCTIHQNKKLMNFSSSFKYANPNDLTPAEIKKYQTGARNKFVAETLANLGQKYSLSGEKAQSLERQLQNHIDVMQSGYENQFR